MVLGLIGLNRSSWLQALTGHDEHEGRAHGKRLRKELISIPARVTRHGHDLCVHAAPEHHDGVFGLAWRALDALLAAATP